MRRKINTTVIHSDRAVVDHVSKVVGENSILVFGGAYTQLDTYLTRTRIVQRETATITPSLIFLDEKFGVEGVNKIMGVSPLSKIVLLMTDEFERVSKNWAEPRSCSREVTVSDHVTLALNAQRSTDFIGIDPVVDKIYLKELGYETMRFRFQNCIAQIRESHRLPLGESLTIGVVGMGEFGCGIVREIRRDETVGSILCSSNYSGFKRTLRSLYESTTGGEKISAYSLEKLIEMQPDILFITTGLHKKGRKKPNFNIPRAQMTDEKMTNFELTCRKIDPILAKLKNKYNGLICIEPNPPGPLISYAILKYGFNPHKVTSFSSDAARAIRETYNYLIHSDKRFAHIPRSALFLDVIGAHGEWAVMCWSSAKMYGIPLREFLKDYQTSNPLLVSDDCLAIEKAVREAGQDVMRESQESKINYFDVPDLVAKYIHEAAVYAVHPTYSAYCTLNSSDLKRLGYEAKFPSAALMLPLRFNYKSGISIARDASRTFTDFSDNERKSLCWVLEAHDVILDRFLQTAPK